MKSLIHCSFLVLILMLTALPGLSQNASGEGQQASLAIDQKDGDQYGWAVNFTTQAEADERALAECEENGADCHVVLQFTGGCGAYVVERGNGSLYGWGTADTRVAAENRAMREAQAIGGKDLLVRVWGCNGGNLVDSKNTSLSVKGVYFFHFTYAQDENRCFITDALYEPGVAQKQGDTWIWKDEAQKQMTPAADQYMDAVEENLYGYLGDLKDEAYTRKELDWAGQNEIDKDNSAINSRNSEREERINGAIKSVKKLCADQGAEIVQVKVDN